MIDIYVTHWTTASLLGRRIFAVDAVHWIQHVTPMAEARIHVCAGRMIRHSSKIYVRACREMSTSC